MLKKSILLGVILTVSHLSAAEVSLSYSVEFDVSTNVPGVSFTGKNTENLIVKLIETPSSLSSFDLSIAPESITTGLSLRDKHMRSKIFKNSAITFKSLKACEFKEKQCELIGELTIANIKKSITLKIKKLADGYSFKQPLSLKSFTIENLGFMGVNVEDEITLSGEAHVK